MRRELDVTRQGVLEGKRTAATLRHELLQVEQQASAAADAHQAEVPILTLTLMADAHQAQVLDSIDRWLASPALSPALFEQPVKWFLSSV